MAELNQFKLERVKKGLSQAELADLMQIQVGTLSHIELGKSKPTIRTMKKWANALGLDYLQALRNISTQPRPDEEKMVNAVGK